MESEKEQHDTLKSAQIGTWSWDLKTNKVYWDDFNHILFGMKPNEFHGTNYDVLQKIIPEDRDRTHNYLKHCIDTGSPIDSSYRVIWPNESIHSLISKGKLFFDENSNPEKMTGIRAGIFPPSSKPSCSLRFPKPYRKSLVKMLL